MHTRVFIPSENQKQLYRKLVLFHGKESVFSNFHPASFEIRGLTFSCSEQYFMYQKAQLAADDDISVQILVEVHPKNMKTLGRRLRMSTKHLEEWSSMSRDVMYRACLEKFSQNEVHRLQLFCTRGMQLVEASPTDKIWGIGLGKNDKRAENPEEWRGSNWLGQVLDSVREELWENPEFRSDREIVEREEIELRCQLLQNFEK